MKMKDVYIFNPYYKLRSDIKRVVITNNDSLFINTFDSNVNDVAVTSFAWPMHPYTALLISYFDGKRTLEEVIEQISKELELSTEVVIESIKNMVENTETVYYPISECAKTLPLPKNLIVKNVSNQERNDILNGIDIDSMMDDLDVNSVRLYIPNELILMSNRSCYTNCIYCYEDRKSKIDQLISIDRIKELINEAKALNMRDFQINGGDFFMYSGWDELLQYLIENNYSPYLSTKVPIGEKTIIKLRDLGIEQIQISLDSLNSEVLKKTISVTDSYLNKMENTLLLLEKYDIKFSVKSVITKFNDSINDINEMLQYILQFNNLSHISFAPAEYSLFSQFDVFRSSTEKMDKIIAYVNELKNQKVKIQDYTRPMNNDMALEDKIENFNNRSACSGNLSAFLILPDGKVTICEQTYWHPALILGDINNQSIMEMWNSEKALSLWNIEQGSIKEESPCKNCPEFEECRRGIRGVCWRIAYTSYGVDNYDFPVPECPRAPEVTEDIYI